MDVTPADDDSITISLTRRQLVLISNALNEVSNGVHIEDFEFETRLGASRTEARNLLAQLSEVDRG